MIRRVVAIAAGSVLFGLGNSAQAQVGRRGGDTAHAGMRGRVGGGRLGGAGKEPAGAQALRRQIRERFGEVVKRQLALTDDQARRLQETDDKFQRQRQDVQRDERDARQGLRSMLEDTTTAPDAPKVEGYLNRLIQAQRKRADLLDAEQKDLAGFLSPVQRAKFLALREQLNRRIAELGQQGGGRRGGAPPLD